MAENFQDCKPISLQIQEVLKIPNGINKNTPEQITVKLLKINGKEPACQCRKFGYNSWAGKIFWRKKWLPIPVFLPEEFHGQRGLAGYSPRGRKKSDMTESLTLLYLCTYAQLH